MTRVDAPQETEWHIITCEYPPTIGGVSDYTYTLASALGALGSVHVWCPVSTGPAPAASNVVVHAELKSFSRRELARLGRRLDASPGPGPRRLFVQWVPQGYGYRSVNLGFAAWLAGRARKHGDQLHLMVHEPFLPWSSAPLHFGGSLLHRAMLVLASARATRIWLSTQTWRDHIRPYVPSATPVEWLPVPAPAIGNASATSIEGHHNGNVTPTVGHFGTHTSLVTRMLEPALDVLLEKTRATVLLIGRDGERFRDAFVGTHPHAATRVKATGVLTLDAAAQEMRQCDVMVQPYPDGVTARRTSTLAPLSLGVPVVTNAGHLTEDFWKDCGAVLLTPVADGRLVGESAAALLTNATSRASLSSLAKDFYDRRFAPHHAVAMLTAAARS